MRKNQDKCFHTDDEENESLKHGSQRDAQMTGGSRGQWTIERRRVNIKTRFDFGKASQFQVRMAPMRWDGAVYAGL